MWHQERQVQHQTYQTTPIQKNFSGNQDQCTLQPFQWKHTNQTFWAILDILDTLSSTWDMSP